MPILLNIGTQSELQINLFHNYGAEKLFAYIEALRLTSVKGRLHSAFVSVHKENASYTYRRKF